MKVVLHTWTAIIICSIVVSSGLAIKLPNTTYLPTDFGPDSIRTIIEHLGFIYEKYEVATEDGYILNLNRMVNPELKHKKNKGIPILIVNGLFGHADGWFMHSDPTLNSPVRWALEGYDVWLGDQRGSIRSINHEYLPVWDVQFWDFSFHETGYYDLPAWIDFILKKTGHKKVAYSGLSDGGAFYYVLTSSRPKYQEKLYGGILWAPVGVAPSLQSMTLPQKMLYHAIYLFLHLTWDVGSYPSRILVEEIFPSQREFRKVLYDTCRLVPPSVLGMMMNIILGEGCHYEPERLCLQLGTFFGGTSAKTVLHTLQLFQNGGEFRQYDYGWEGNIHKYGDLTPPEYKISNLRVFTALYFSDIDIFVPARVVRPFALKFSGPAYECQVDNTCHLYVLTDNRLKPYLDDATYVLDEITSRNSHKPKPRLHNHILRCNVSNEHLSLKERKFTTYENQTNWRNMAVRLKSTRLHNSKGKAWRHRLRKIWRHVDRILKELKALF